MPTNRKFHVSIKIASNPETGESFVLFSDREIEERNIVLLDDLEEAIDAWPPGKDEPEIKEQAEKATALRTAIHAEINAHTARQKAERDAALTYAEDYDFNVALPTYGEDSNARQAATTLDIDGTFRFRQESYLREMLKICVEGMTAKDIAGLPPIVASELEFRLLRAIRPNPNRLGFCTGTKTAD